MDLLDLKHLLHLFWTLSPLCLKVCLSLKLLDLVIRILFVVDIEDAHSVLLRFEISVKIKRACFVDSSSSILLSIRLLVSLLNLILPGLQEGVVQIFDLVAILIALASIVLEHVCHYAH